MRLQARIGLQHPTDAVTLLLDGRLPTPAAPLGLVLPLQQMGQDDIRGEHVFTLRHPAHVQRIVEGNVTALLLRIIDRIDTVT